MIFESDFINEDSMRYYVIQHVKREVCDVISSGRRHYTYQGNNSAERRSRYLIYDWTIDQMDKKQILDVETVEVIIEMS